MNHQIKYLVQLIDENKKVIKSRAFYHKDIAIALQNKYSRTFDWCTSRVIQVKA